MAGKKERDHPEGTGKKEECNKHNVFYFNVCYIEKDPDGKEWDDLL